MNRAADLPSPSAATSDGDPYLWLEEIEGERALAWVRGRNAETERLLDADPEVGRIGAEVLEVLDSQAQIPQVVRRGDALYNFWRDAAHPRGLWRRTTLAEYRRETPAWQVLLDLDALARSEGIHWVWAGATVLAPAYRAALVRLSRGGADATVVREFDLERLAFVDPVSGSGFALAEAKSEVEWIDRDTIYVATDFGPGTLTAAGYPRIVKRWRRGEPLAAAAKVFEGEPGDTWVWMDVDATPGHERTTFGRGIDFYRSRVWLAAPDGSLREVDKPADAKLTFWRSRVLVELRSDWETGGRRWPGGALLLADAAAYLGGAREFVLLFAPTPTRSLAAVATSATAVLVTVLDDVASRIEEWTLASTGWQRREVAAPYPGTLAATALHDPEAGPPAADPLAESYLLATADFLAPDSLQLGRIGSDERETLKTRPAYFDASGMRVEQRFARSSDGTRVPYFVVWPRNASADSDRPTLLYGYGGFEVSLQPAYSGAVGRAWLARGGVHVVANIRGGGEFGPAWHQAAQRAHRQRAFEDFVAVAEDLIATRVTRPGRLAIQGGSNGGLLVGAVMLARPELYAAVVCQVPLLDMRRYHRLLAGASWIAEYGDPDDPEQWAFIGRYSPYQNVPPASRTKLPRVLLVTSTRDDRVHPGHARKMAARLRELGHEVLYWENLEGGHGGAADNAQRARMIALEYGFLWQTLARR
jgi:prolyl oligopeptidase